ncbi:nucleoporin alm1-like [Scomber scombrus]|uniref:Nucleoporin alm1-like n=1 Tax=Scomber scombrus TaxID=13677 RepID=A0AAV1PNZ8_SCOSC
MARRNISRHQASSQMQREDSEYQRGQQCHEGPGMVRDLRNNIVQSLRQSLRDSRAENQQLASEVSALKQQLAGRELGWEQERTKLLSEKDTLATNLSQANKNTSDMEGGTKQLQKQFYDLCWEMNMKLQQKEEEVQSLKQTLHQEVTQQVAEQNLSQANKKISDMEEDAKQLQKQLYDLRLEMSDKLKQKEEEVHSLKQTLHQEVTQLNAEWESRLLKQKEVAADQKHLQEDLETKLHQVSQEKADMTAIIIEKEKELMDSLAKLSQNEITIKTNESDWKDKYEGLKKRLLQEEAEKMAAVVKAQLLQRKHLKVEDERIKNVKHITNLSQANKKISDMEEDAKQLQKQLYDLRWETNKKLKQKEEEVHSLKQTLHQEVTKRVNDQKHLQEDLETKLHQISQEMADMTAIIIEKEKELMDSLAKLSQTETQYEALEKLLSDVEDEEMAEVEEEQELQTEHLIEILKQQNDELQELAKLTDKEKVKIRKRRKKAQKEMEKMLKKERKEEEKEEKKRLKKEKKERDEKDKKEKKEQKEHDKKEKERLKKENKERKDREKKEKERESY